MNNEIFKMSSAPKKALAGLAFLALSGATFAQHEVAFSSEIGQPGDTVTVDFTFTNTGGDSALEARARIDTIAPFASIDATNLCSGASADFVSCALNDTNRLVVTATNFDGTTAIPDFTGTVVFNIDATAVPPQTIDIVWNAAADSGQTFTPSASTDGQIQINSGPQSELVVTPALPFGFGTVDTGSTPVTQQFTALNDGTGADLTISGVTLATGAEFSIINDNCTSATLAQSQTCTFDVQFDTGTDGMYTDTLTVDSDADVNGTVTGDVTADATSAPNLSISPAFGPVDLGTIVVGNSNSANGSVSNSGSADGSYTCTLSGDPQITSTPASPISDTVAPGGSSDFSLTCAVPDTAVEGDAYTATLECTGDITGTHNISCSATEFVPLPVPTNSTWGLAILTLLMLMIGGFTVRFFRT